MPAISYKVESGLRTHNQVRRRNRRGDIRRKTGESTPLKIFPIKAESLRVVCAGSNSRIGESMW